MQKFLHDSTEFLPILLQGVWLTILVTLGSLILSTILGLLWALMRVSGVRALSGVSAGLINLIRGIPIIVLLLQMCCVGRALVQAFGRQFIPDHERPLRAEIVDLVCRCAQLRDQ